LLDQTLTNDTYLLDRADQNVMVQPHEANRQCGDTLFGATDVER